MGNGNGDGMMAMVPEDVTEAGHRIQTSGDTLRSQWVPTAAAIIGAEAGIGHGRLADAFAPTYRQASIKVRANADAMPAWFTELATATVTSANLYSTTDTDAADRFRALTGTRRPPGPMFPGGLPGEG